MVSIKQLAAGLIRFIDTEMIPALPVRQQWLAGTALYLAQDKLPDIIERATDNALVYMLVRDDKGNVDVESSYKAAKAACQRFGSLDLDIPLFGSFKAKEQDFDTLYECIMSEAGGKAK